MICTGVSGFLSSFFVVVNSTHQFEIVAAHFQPARACMCCATLFFGISIIVTKPEQTIRLCLGHHLLQLSLLQCSCKSACACMCMCVCVRSRVCAFVISASRALFLFA